ncbi:MAG: anhydro-N-acetylmuramic acid kinase [Gammaproteobacteria bacterium]|nr:anhydro-N-acetylmuramic acid kinase [Gammaproteobacteria bacterium]
MADYYVGLMSGTSMDALDAVLVDFATTPPTLVDGYHLELGSALRHEIMGLCAPGDNEIERLSTLDVQLGRLSAEAVRQLLAQNGVAAAAIKGIGSHGQTVRHSPASAIPYTLQIGDPNTIAQLSGIATVADFRRRDMAAGGQGAPLVPAFHQTQFHSPNKNRVILNIGGIANITILPAATSQPVSGFDTGPGNMLMDGWSQLHQNRPYDENGNWARSGKVVPELLNTLLADAYLSLPPPKSTGRERYNLPWLQTQLPGQLLPQDVQATLCEQTATTIASAILQYAPTTEEIYLCGGGACNGYLLERIAAHLGGRHLATTAELGVDPQWVEAMAFAWLARQTLRHLPGNLPAVTGAREAVILGGIYPATPR